MPRCNDFQTAATIGPSVNADPQASFDEDEQARLEDATRVLGIVNNALRGAREARENPNQENLSPESNTIWPYILWLHYHGHDGALMNFFGEHWWGLGNFDKMESNVKANKGMFPHGYTYNDFSWFFHGNEDVALVNMVRLVSHLELQGVVFES
jgi:hypothetical protein